MKTILYTINEYNTIFVALISSFVTLLIAKYTYHLNRPVDKLEIAYNRIYYPIYRLIKIEEKPTTEIIDKCHYYLLKYNKYVDSSTNIAFNYLLKDNKKNRFHYNNFRNNIFNKNTYLRHKLGYLQSNIFENFKYFSPNDKLQFRFLCEMLTLYMSAVFYSYNDDKVKTVCIYLATFVLFAFILELIFIFINKINKFFYWIKYKD